MAAQSGVRVEGLSKLVRELQQLGIEVDDLKDAFQAISQEAASRASSHAPRKSGALAASVRGNRAKSKAVVRAGGARLPYAGPINYGWPKRGIAAAGFMQKADAEMLPISLVMLENGIKQAIRRRGLA